MKEKMLYWLHGKKNHIFYGIAFIIVAIFSFFKMFHHKESTDFLAIEKTYHHWEETGENIDELATAIEHHPELATKFGALIADRFILQKKGNDAKPFAEAVFQRISRYVPEHTAYAEGSLLIAQGNIVEAYQQTSTLKDRISKDSFLYGFTLMRIASLARVLNAKEQESSALEELENFIQSKTENAKILADCFSSEKTLQDYIIFRKNQIN